MQNNQISTFPGTYESTVTQVGMKKFPWNDTQSRQEAEKAMTSYLGKDVKMPNRFAVLMHFDIGFTTLKQAFWLHTPGSHKRTTEMLAKVFSIHSLAEINKANGQKAELVVEAREYNGRLRNEVAWVNPVAEEAPNDDIASIDIFETDVVTEEETVMF